MYRLDERLNRKKKKKLLLLIGLIFLIILGSIGYFFYRVSHVKTTLSTSKGTVTVVVSPDSQTVNYDEADFSISLPKTWQPVKVVSSLYKIYEWKSTSAGSQILDVYQDTIPEGFAVNRELALQPEGGKLLIVGFVSDNCANFTKVGTSGVQATPAKWQGVNFLCDEANFERDIVGTGSSAGINTVALAGSSGVTHKFFFVYNNYSLSSDFTVLYQILNSFYVK